MQCKVHSKLMMSFCSAACRERKIKNPSEQVFWFILATFYELHITSEHYFFSVAFALLWPVVVYFVSLFCILSTDLSSLLLALFFSFAGICFFPPVHRFFFLFLCCCCWQFLIAFSLHCCFYIMLICSFSITTRWKKNDLNKSKQIARKIRVLLHILVYFIRLGCCVSSKIVCWNFSSTF